MFRNNPDNNYFISGNANCGCCVPQNRCSPTPCQPNRGPRGPVGPIGPQGVKGDQGIQGIQGTSGADGADGLIGSIQGVVQTSAQLPDTGIEQGTMYYVEDQNTVYVWDETEGWTNIGMVQGPRGIQGEQGEKGDKGDDGFIGSIQGVVQTQAQLPTTGIEQGTMYYVEDENSVYVWDETEGWTNIGMVQGPRGIQGEQGEKGDKGDDGFIGSIQGVVQTQAQLPTTGIEQGTMYYVEDENTVYVWDETEGWTNIGMVQGPRGIQGEQGIQGIQGEQGEQGTSLELLGAYPTLADLIAAHPNGNTGDAYAVNGTIYVWDTDTGSWQPAGSVGASGLVLLGAYSTLAALQAAHPIGNPGDAYAVNGTIYVWDTDTRSWQPAGPVGAEGPQGPEGSSFTIIPFSSQQAPYVGTNNGGEPVNVALLGFGYLEYSTGGTANVAIDIDQNDGSFNLTGTANHQVVFSLPYDVTLNSIYITVGNWGDFGLIVPTGTLIYPYVHVYAAEPGTNSFSPIADAFAVPMTGIDPVVAVAATMRSGSKTGLNIDLPAGTRIAICGMMQITGDTAGRNYYMYFTGGIGMKIRASE